MIQVKGNFSGTQLFTEITNQTGLSHPTMSLNAASQTALITFHKDHKVGTVYEMITTEQALVVNSYDKPKSSGVVKDNQYFRGLVEESQKLLTPILRHANCLSFDQSYYTRTIGQIEIQRKLEDKEGILKDKYSLFSGAGFGAIQAFWSALGWQVSDLQKWFLTAPKKAIKKGLARKTTEVSISILMNKSFDRLSTKSLAKELKKVFSVNGRELTVRDCLKDVFIPVQDISGLTKVISKESYPNMPIHIAVGACIFDPVFFDTKQYFDNMGILNGDIVKNNDQFIRKNNQTLAIDSIGCPVRKYNKGSKKITREDLALRISDQKHETDLIVSKSISGNYRRFECHPIDEVYQFATSDKAIQLALSSADLVEV